MKISPLSFFLPCLAACGGLSAGGEAVRFAKEPAAIECKQLSTQHGLVAARRDEDIVYMRNWAAKYGGNYVQDAPPQGAEHYRLVAYKCP